MVDMSFRKVTVLLLYFLMFVTLLTINYTSMVIIIYMSEDYASLKRILTKRFGVT